MKLPYIESATDSSRPLVARFRLRSSANSYPFQLKVAGVELGPSADEYCIVSYHQAMCTSHSSGSKARDEYQSFNGISTTLTKSKLPENHDLA